MTLTIVGKRMWEGEREDDSHRNWTLDSYISSTDPLNGPASVMAWVDGHGFAIGAEYNIGNDFDTWAFCYPTMKVSRAPKIEDGEPVYHWIVRQKFSTRPLRRCNTLAIENPLDEPVKISGSYVKYTKEAQYDRFGNQIRTSSFEKIHGPPVEFDANRMSVRMEWNISSFNPHEHALYVDTVNDATLWGFDARQVKLSNITYERRLYGTCSFYYNRVLEFDTDYRGFDRDILDEGQKVLKGEWATTAADPTLLTYRKGVPLPPGSLWKLTAIDGKAPDRSNPQHYMRYKDRNGEMGRVVLDGNGEPATLGEPESGQSSSSEDTANTGGTTAGNVHIEYYGESNMLALGIPTSL